MAQLRSGREFYRFHDLAGILFHGRGCQLLQPYKHKPQVEKGGSVNSLLNHFAVFMATEVELSVGAHFAN